MKQALLKRLAAMPGLGVENRTSARCKICHAGAPVFDVVDFNKYCSASSPYEFGISGIEVAYYRCPACQFMFTGFFDDWTTQELARFIYNDDYIKVDGEYAGARPARQAAEVARFLAGMTELHILDYGSGSGLFAQHLRGHGLAHVDSYDPFSHPCKPAARFDIITCYEVLEHALRPLATLRDIAGLLKPGGCVLFSTGIQPPEIESLRAGWWYVGPRNGHASIFSLNALAAAAQSAGLLLHAGGNGLAFAGPGPSAQSRSLLAAIGGPVRFFRLGAPAPGEKISPLQENCWHGPESGGDFHFRWSAAASLAWQLQASPLASGAVTLVIPFCNQIREGFAEACSFQLGSHRQSATRLPGALSASFLLTEETDPIARLITPPLLRPSDLQPVSDDRWLGLAIGIAGLAA